MGRLDQIDPAISACKASGSGSGWRAEDKMWRWLAQKAHQGTKGKVIGHERFACGHVLHLDPEITLLPCEQMVLVL